MSRLGWQVFCCCFRQNSDEVPSKKQKHTIKIQLVQFRAIKKGGEEREFGKSEIIGDLNKFGCNPQKCSLIKNSKIKSLDIRKTTKGLKSVIAYIKAHLKKIQSQ